MKIWFPSVEKLSGVLDCGGKRSATPLWERNSAVQKRRRRFALPAQSKTIVKRASVLWFLPIALTFAASLFAADTASDFSTANRFYAEGKFSEAAKAYGAILQTGAQSPALLFNYGNAEFKLGNLGKAISAFRRAELLAPRDPEIRANLNFVRNQVQGPAIRESRWGEWLGTFSLDEWALLAAAAFWLTFLLFAARQIRPALVSKLRSVTRLAVALTVLSGAALGVQAANHFNSPVAVVTDAEATARSGPFDEAQNAFTARDGAELSILDRHADWVQITDGAGKIGWLPTTQVEILPGA